MRKGQFILDGIIITKDKNIALLREITTRKMVRVELGQEINGMQIEKLERDKITFKQGDEREELILRIKTGPSQPGKSGSPGVPTRLAAPAVPLPGAPVAAPAENDPRSVFERRRALRQQPPE
jgi:type II secretory pathway component PulC